MPLAYCLIREQPVYRREAFVQGLRRAGFEVVFEPPRRGKPGDLLIIWNRYSSNHDCATRFEATGGLVMVAENAYLRGRRDGGDYFALALDAHNGRGRWPVGGLERWNALDIELKPWRTSGEHVLVAPNRAFGQPGSAMPAPWPHDVKKRLLAVTKREIRVRAHPGEDRPAVALEDDLRDAWGCVIWSSSVGVKALIAGIPVICEGRWWICKVAADMLGIENIDSPCGYAPIRAGALQALAWAQWRAAELATGEPFVRLLEHASKTERSAA